MVNYSKAFSDTSWFNVAADGEDYILQVKKGAIFAKVSAAMPTSADGSFEIEAKDGMSSNILSGNLWVRSVDGSGLIAYAK